MEFTKTAKLHIRLTEDVAREVRAIADLEHRPIQDQLRYLIVLGLQVVRSGVQGNDDTMRRLMPPDAAQSILPAPPIAASRHAAPHRKMG